VTHAEIHRVAIRDGIATAGTGRRERFDARGRTLAVFRPHLPDHPATTERLRTEVREGNGHGFPASAARGPMPNEPGRAFEEAIATRGRADERFAIKGQRSLTEAKGPAPAMVPAHSERPASETRRDHAPTPPAP